MSAAFDKLLLRWIADTLHWYVHRDDKKEEGGAVSPPPQPPENTGRDDVPIDAP